MNKKIISFHICFFLFGISQIGFACVLKAHDSNINRMISISDSPFIDENFEHLLGSKCITNGIEFYSENSDNVFQTEKSFIKKIINIGAKEYEPKIIKGSYLIYPGNGYRIMINWQLNYTDTCFIQWGFEPNNFIDSLFTLENDSNYLEHIHSVILDSLFPNTKYYYKVKTSLTVQDGSFISPQDSNALNTFFYAFGDSRSAVQNLDSLAAQINNEVAKDSNSQTFVLHTGDWTTSGAEDEWQNEVFNNSYSNILELLSKMPIQGVRGNHENYFNSQASVYQKYWPYNYETPENGLYYSFDYGPVHFSIIDQYSPYDSNSIQYNWLTNDLIKTQKPWKVLAFHEPGYSDGVHVDNIDVQNRLQPLCEKYNIPIVLAGHNHYYAHNLINGVHHLTLGGGGSPLYNPLGTGQGLIKSEKSFHFAKIEVDSAIISVSIIRPDGTIIENFSIVNNAPIFNSNPVLNVFEDSTYKYEIACTDLEKDNITISTDTIPPWMTIIDNGEGTAILTGKPSNSDVGIYHIKLNASDLLSSSYQKFDIEVINSNDEPEFISEPRTETFEDSLYTYLVICNDEDADELKIETRSLPKWLSFEDFGNGTAILSGIPLNDNVGTHLINLLVSDSLSSSIQSFELDVINTNDFPEFVSMPLEEVYHDTIYRYQIQCIDVDNDSLIIRANDIPFWLKFDDLGSGKAELYGFPGFENIGIDSVALSVFDGMVTVNQEFEISIIERVGVNDNFINEFTIFPNPVHKYIQIKFDSEVNDDINCIINNLEGRIVYKETYLKTINHILLINTSSLEKGIYILNLKSADIKINFKFIKY